MEMKSMFKKIVLSGLTLAMVLGGSTAAFADSKGKGNNGKQDDDKGKPKSVVTTNIKANNINLNFFFNDIRGGDVEWALQYIAALSSKGVFSGYEDGSFQPRKPINRIEAIKAAVMTMDLGTQAETKEAMSKKLNFKDANQIPSWAVGYVATALENGLFAETDTSVQPQKEADRLWATILLVKALKLDGEALKQMNTKLNFKDANQIPAGSVGYVAVAVEKGLINGYDDKSFRPNQPVTRAEMAALLSRTNDQLDDKSFVTGKISGAVNSNYVLITAANGQQTPYALNNSVFVLRNGVSATIADLKVGDEVKLQTIKTNAGLLVYYIEVTKAADQQNNNDSTNISGTITTAVYNNNWILISKNGQNTPYALHSNVFVLRNGAAATTADLKVGDEVKLQTVTVNNVTSVYYIEVTKAVDQNVSTTSVEGFFNAINKDDNNHITAISIVRVVDNQLITYAYPVDANVQIVGGSESNLTQNRKVKLGLISEQNQTVLKIEIQ